MTNFVPIGKARVARLVTPTEMAQPVTTGAFVPDLGQALVDSGRISAETLDWATRRAARSDIGVERVLLAHACLSEDDLLDTRAEITGAGLADLSVEPPDGRLVDQFGALDCLSARVLPWVNRGGATLIATPDPAAFAAAQDRLTALFGPVRMVLCTNAALTQAVLELRSGMLAARAEVRVDDRESCRDWSTSALKRNVLVLAFLILGTAILAPMALFIAALALSVAILTLNTAVKLVASLVTLRARRPSPLPPATEMARLPVISVMVPLYKEREIAAHLIKRLNRLTYPRELTDVLLVVEADDHLTHEALAAIDLPPWIRRIDVPAGTLRTKPRALNFALDFCRGSIIGIWDAEDAPDPDQLHKVVAAFARHGPQVACLQGVLDYYNARNNWLARCFTIEYATWFRLVLPGLARMGLVVPLGGTTLFMRRVALEQLGAWDAHNVTEDADLGLRLARHGFRTELIRTVTHEEANCAAIPWIKQRSRWLKGYGITWGVHMRRPRTLLRQLGWRRFAGVQLVYLGALSQFLLAPVLWSFWVLPFGLWHPLSDTAGAPVMAGLASLFILCEAIGIGIGIKAASMTRHHTLRRFVPTMLLYFPLGTLAAYKALWEMLSRPFYWDKTRHGLFQPTHRGRAKPRRD